MAQLWQVDGNVKDVTPSNGKYFTLTELYQYTDCNCVEFVYLPKGQIMVVDEDGINRGLPINEKATQLYRDTFGTKANAKARLKELEALYGKIIDADPTPEQEFIIVGPVLVCPQSQIR